MVSGYFIKKFIVQNGDHTVTEKNFISTNNNSVALGFLHMQSVYFRDKYIRFNPENLKSRIYAKNFKRYSMNQYDDFDLGYDYDSILHYKRDAFSKSKELPTVTTLDIRYLDSIGQREKMSQRDITKLNTVYKCDVVWAKALKQYLESKKNKESN